MPKLVKKVVVVKRPVTATSSTAPARTEEGGNNDDDDSNHASPPPQQQQQPELDPTTMSRQELEHTFLQLRAELAAKDRIIAKLTTEVTLLRRIQLQHDREQQQQQPSRTRSVVVVRTSRSKSAVPRHQQQQRVAGPEIYAAAEELRRQGFGMTAETVAAAAAAAQEQQQQRGEQASAAAAASSSSTSSEPLLSCSECHQQLPKSEFSSSQAKKLVGRKCKQCVVKVAEIEAQLREEAAANELREKNRIAMEQLVSLEQTQRKIIADEEAAAFRKAARFTPEAAYLRQLNKTLDAFLATRDWPKADDSRRPVFHEWLFSMESGHEPSMVKLSVEHRPTEQAAALLLRDKGWTLVAAFDVLAGMPEFLELTSANHNLTKLFVCALLYLINSLIDAGALGMLPRPWRNEHNPMQQIKLLFRDTMQRLVQRVDAAELHCIGTNLFGVRVLGAAFLVCVLRILQHGDTEAATSTEDDVVEFLKFLIASNVATAYKARTRSNVCATAKEWTVATAMNDLIRFLFIAPASDKGSSSHQPSRCFVARLLGLSNNDVPERIAHWLCVLISQCHSKAPSALQLWFDLVADLFCDAPTSVISELASSGVSEETTSRYGVVSGSTPMLKTVYVLFAGTQYSQGPVEVSQQIDAHRSRAAAALSAHAQRSNDPVFKERAREFTSLLELTVVATGDARQQ